MRAAGVKGDDHDRWLNGMRRLQAKVEEATGQQA
jgi:hypothetical protein